jgi:hypothetical protein
VRSSRGKRRWVLCALAVTALALSASALAASDGQTGFGFNARDISGFPNGAATLTGGGAYSPVTGFVKSAGGSRCTSDVLQGPLAGCLTGEGVRWDTVELRRSTTFKCTGAAAAELLKTATTNAGHRQDPERLNSGCWLHLRDYELQQLRPLQATAASIAPATSMAGASPR